MFYGRQCPDLMVRATSASKFYGALNTDFNQFLQPFIRYSMPAQPKESGVMGPKKFATPLRLICLR